MQKVLPTADPDQQQAYLAAIVQSSDDAIIGVSMEGRINFWNNGADRIFGYTADEAAGESIDILVPGQADEYADFLEKHEQRCPPGALRNQTG